MLESQILRRRGVGCTRTSARAASDTAARGSGNHLMKRPWWRGRSHERVSPLSHTLSLSLAHTLTHTLSYVQFLMSVAQGYLAREKPHPPRTSLIRNRNTLGGREPS